MDVAEGACADLRGCAVCVRYHQVTAAMGRGPEVSIPHRADRVGQDLVPEPDLLGLGVGVGVGVRVELNPAARPIGLGKILFPSRTCWGYGVTAVTGRAPEVSLPHTPGTN